MESTPARALEQFQDHVAVPFQLYNSLFTALPFNRIEKTGILLSLFLNNCEEGYEAGKSPFAIVENFFENHASIKSEAEKMDMLFRFVQYAERQVVLFDALEDAAFEKVNDMQGRGTLKHLESEVLQKNGQDELIEKLRSFYVRLVLTAHPTQFYPGSVLGIINDLVEAISENNVSKINMYLQQLGRTPFIKRQKPTPFDEAVSLIWYLENVFYDAVGNIVSEMNGFLGRESTPVKMGFWPGGDRDGNPYVTVDTTLQVAAALRNSISRCYYSDVRRLKRRLTFSGIEAEMGELENRLCDIAYSTGTGGELPIGEVLASLRRIQSLLVERHNGLFVDLVNTLIYKVESFGWHFASLDIRQDSSVHSLVLGHIAEDANSLPKNYEELSDGEKISVLFRVDRPADNEKLTDDLAIDTLKTIAAVKTIQQQNGPEGCSRYIISHSQTALDVVEVYGLFLLAGWSREEISVDIVPLFESVTDLENAAEVMRELYETEKYREHLQRRHDTQPIMLGFSDGTKDGGYLTANWSIYKAKKELTKISREHGIEPIFFDGRGGPPARGGGKTHQFYASMGDEISDVIELTIQGQTVSSNFGTVSAAQFNFEQLLHAGLYKDLFSGRPTTFTDEEEALMKRLADESFAAYEGLKNHPLFLDYLSHASPLRFYGQTNIGSRPVKRGTSKKLELSDLRAIPFVSAWSQIKQNVPGYYGVGTAIQTMDREGRLEEVKRLYENNPFFKTLIDNCEMAMEKCFFPLTRFLADDETYGEIWRMIHDEFELTRQYLLLISGNEELMEDHPVDRQSVLMRERIMLPLTTIQQYGLTKLRDGSEMPPETTTAFEKLVTRCSFGIINAGRNSA